MKDLSLRSCDGLIDLLIGLDHGHLIVPVDACVGNYCEQLFWRGLGGSLDGHLYREIARV